MTRRYASADVPEFSTYPAPPEPAPDRIGSAGSESSDLNERARKIGGVLGRAVATVRETTGRASEMVRDTSEQVQEKVHEIRRHAHEAADHIHLDEMEQRATARAREIRERTREGLQEARTRARTYARENPYHVILAGGVVGLILGALLRTTLVRGHHE